MIKLGGSNMGGTVTLYNPTSSDVGAVVNGMTPFPIPACAPSKKWQPFTGPRNPVQSDDGQRADGKFGKGENDVLATSVSGIVNSFNVAISPEIDPNSELQLYLFLDGDANKARYVLLVDGKMDSSEKAVPPKPAS